MTEGHDKVQCGHGLVQGLELLSVSSPDLLFGTTPEEIIFMPWSSGMLFGLGMPRKECLWWKRRSQGGGTSIASKGEPSYHGNNNTTMLWDMYECSVLQPEDKAL